MTTQHTPTPWEIDNSGTVDPKDQGDILLNCAARGEMWVPIGISDKDGFAEITAFAHDSNAAFIVRACNSHEQLVEAVRYVLNNLDGAAHEKLISAPRNFQIQLNESAKMLRAALKAATTD